ncbi:unnamed protein product, partial [marine sediment metagenome]
MEDQETLKFRSNMVWFNNFFGGVKQLFDLVYDHISNDFVSSEFELKSTNYHFPRQNYSPSIPPYYVLMVPGIKWAMQLILIVDEDLISQSSYFSVEP